MTRDESNAAAYHRARRLSPLNVFYYDAWVRRLLEQMPSTDGTLLELMCGEGEVSRRLGPRFTSVFAVDLDVPMLKVLARDLAAAAEARVRPLCANAASLPLSDASIDAVGIIGGLHHARPLLTRILGEIGRVLRPGGVLVASEPANDNALIRGVRHWQYRRTTRQGQDEDEDGFTEAELRAPLAAQGLRLDRYEVFGFLAYPLMGNTDLLPLLANCRSIALGRLLLALDGALERTPLVRRFGWASLFRAVKDAPLAAGR